MGSECTICINFSKNFPGGGPPNPHLRDGGIPLPHPPPAALRADMFTPPAVDSLDPPLFFEITGSSVFTNTSCLSFCRFGASIVTVVSGSPPPPPRTPTCGTGVSPSRTIPPPAALRADLFTPPAVDPLDPPLFFEITGPSVFTNTSCLSFFFAVLVLQY